MHRANVAETACRRDSSVISPSQPCNDLISRTSDVRLQSHRDMFSRASPVFHDLAGKCYAMRALLWDGNVRMPWLFGLSACCRLNAATRKWVVNFVSNVGKINVLPLTTNAQRQKTRNILSFCDSEKVNLKTSNLTVFDFFPPNLFVTWTKIEHHRNMRVMSEIQSGIYYVLFGILPPKSCLVETQITV